MQGAERDTGRTEMGIDSKKQEGNGPCQPLDTQFALARLSSSRNERMCTETSHGRFPTKSLVSSGLKSAGVGGWVGVGCGAAANWGGQLLVLLFAVMRSPSPDLVVETQQLVAAVHRVGESGCRGRK